ncbi:MAG: MarR family transcriptional regulator [Pelomonas sp.]|nr:MarR family transcriptional regulator [Roseateles sp.]
MVNRFYHPDKYRRDESLGWLFMRAKSSIGAECDQRLSDHGLTHAQWVPLLTLHLHGPSPVAELVRALDIDAGAVSRLVDRLEAKGLCRRERSNSDRRVVMVSLTEAGARVTEELTAVLSDVFNAHLQGFTHAEWRMLVDLLRRFIANGDALREAREADPHAPHSHQEES